MEELVLMYMQGDISQIYINSLARKSNVIPFFDAYLEILLSFKIKLNITAKYNKKSVF